MKSSSFRPRLIHLALFGAFVLAPVLARMTLLLEKRIALRAADLHGLLVDVLVALVLAALMAPLIVKRRWPIALLVPWCVLNYMSYEFTRTMNAVPPWQSVGYLGDGTFVRGSVLAIASPLLLATILAGPTALLWLATRRRAASDAPTALRAPLPFAPAAVVLGIVNLAWPTDRALFVWRQTNFIAGNASDLLEPDGRKDLPPLTSEQQKELDALFRADLGGKERVPPLPNKPNVLLVLLEGISGTDLPSVADLHHHGGAAAMPELDELGKRNVYFRSFITHQRGTNRGLYASLCGDYPKLGTGIAKMTERASGPDLECLPAVLRRNGYETVFLQAAPLAFMLKDTFMPKIGFSQTLGSEQFTTQYARSNWGVDDRAFFERTRTMVSDLRAKKKPWMMTLLTVGTHHPYPVPESFSSPEAAGTFRRAARYTDMAVAELVRGLSADGALEDTVVLISSDESHGDEDHGDDLSKLLTQNLSFMVAVVPTKARHDVDELFVQSDTAVSVLDLVGLGRDVGPFVGRSMFRSYADPRRVFIANQNARTVGMVDSAQRNVWSCNEHFAACDHFQLGGASFVIPERRVTPPSREDRAFLRGARDRAAGQAVSPFRELQLTSDRLVRVHVDDKDGQLLYAGQYLELPAGTFVDVDLEVEAVGSGELEWNNDLMASFATKVLVQPKPFVLKGGEGAVLRYSYRVAEPLRGVESRAVVRRLGSEEIAIRFTRATLKTHPGPNDGTPSWVNLREHTIRRGPGVN